MSARERVGTLQAGSAGGALSVSFEHLGGGRLELPAKLLRKLSGEMRRRLQAGALVRVQVAMRLDGSQVITRFLGIERDAPAVRAPRRSPRAAPRPPRPEPSPRGNGSAGETRLQRLVRLEREGHPEVNPYTFIPFLADPPRDRNREPWPRTAPWPSVEPGQVLSGRFRVTLEIATPVAILGEAHPVLPTHRARPQAGRWFYDSLSDADKTAAAEDLDKNGHTEVSLLADADGCPIVPGATLKGVMRSWFEAITSSNRLVSDAPVTWRTTAVAPRRLPGMVQVRRDGNPFQDQLRTVKDKALNSLQVRIAPMSSWRPAEDPDDEERAERFSEHWQLGDRLVDGDEVTATDGQRGRLKVSAGMDNPPTVSVQVFVETGSEPVDVPADTVREWHVAHKAAGRAGKPVEAQWGGRTRVLQRPESRRLCDGDLVWYDTDDLSGAVTYFGRIKFGRWAARNPMQGRVPPGHAAPDPPELSPADRVFGTAGKPGSEAAVAWAGRVRVSTARWSLADGGPAPRRTLTLEPLSSPKVSSAGLYLTEPGAERLSWRPEAPGRLAGTKVYWHTPPLPTEAAHARVRLADDGGTPCKTSQNATVETVTAGRFVFDVWFEDLGDDELGALLLSCSLAFDDGDAPCGWKLGIGKPVGLGSVVNTVSELRICDLDARLDDPITPTAGWRDPGPDETVAVLQALALDTYMPKALDRRILAGIAALDAVAERVVRYPQVGTLPRDAAGASFRQPNAREVLMEDAKMRLVDRAAGQRDRQ